MHAKQRGVDTPADAHELTRPLKAFVAVHNHGSRRVLEKCGFRALGELVTHEDRLGGQLFELAQ